MFYSANVKGQVHWIGVNDRRKRLFENIWPLDKGVSYNSYLIVDQKTALVDTIEDRASGNYIERIERLLNGRKLDYLIINHMEPDHSGEVKTIFEHFKGVHIVGNVKTFKMIEAYWGINTRLLRVDDGDELSLGHHNLKFVMTPWVHWPETMMTYDTTDRILFSGDAFGSFGTLDGGIFDDELDTSEYIDEMRRYYSNIVGKYSNMVQKAFAKLKGIPVAVVAPTHGPVWRQNPDTVLALYDAWSKYEAQDGVVIAVASMYGNTELMADYIARKLSEKGVKKIRIHDVSKSHISHIISDIWNYKGLILGSCAYNSFAFPLMEQLTRELSHMKIKNRLLGVFGSYSWSGGGAKHLAEFAEDMELTLVAEPVDLYGLPSEAKLQGCDTLANAMAEKLKS